MLLPPSGGRSPLPWHVGAPVLHSPGRNGTQVAVLGGTLPADVAEAAALQGAATAGGTASS